MKKLFIILLMTLALFVSACTKKNDDKDIKKVEQTDTKQTENKTYDKDEKKDAEDDKNSDKAKGGEEDKKTDKTGEKENPSGEQREALEVDYYKQELHKDIVYKTVVIEESEYSAELVFMANEELRDFNLYSVSLEESGDTLKESFGEILCSEVKIPQGKSIRVKLVFHGDFTVYGVSYRNESGEEKRIIIGQSGMDGSIYTNEYNEEDIAE